MEIAYGKYFHAFKFRLSFALVRDTYCSSYPNEGTARGILSSRRYRA